MLCDKAVIWFFIRFFSFMTISRREAVIKRFEIGSNECYWFVFNFRERTTQSVLHSAQVVLALHKYAQLAI